MSENEYEQIVIKSLEKNSPQTLKELRLANGHSSANEMEKAIQALSEKGVIEVKDGNFCQLAHH